MPSFQRRIVAFLLCAGLLAGCGFRPLLGSQSGSSAVSDDLAAIRITPIPDRSGQILRNALLDSLTPRGSAIASRYVLNIRLQEPRQTIALRRDDVISRSSYSAVATFDLVNRDGRKLAFGTSTFSTDYEIAVSEFATRSSLEDARSRVMSLIADDIRNQLAAALARHDSTN